MRLEQSIGTSAPSRSPNSFDKLLIWLDSDRDKAGKKYESIRCSLTKLFESRDAYISEELADETIDRVMNKIDFLSATYEGDPAPYFFGVAKNVFREFVRKPILRPLPTVLPSVSKTDNTPEKYDRCLSKALATLSPSQSQLIIKYYEGETQTKIQNRKKLAQDLSISIDTLRVRVHRIRGVVQKRFLKELDAFGTSSQRKSRNETRRKARFATASNGV